MGRAGRGQIGASKTPQKDWVAGPAAAKTWQDKDTGVKG